MISEGWSSMDTARGAERAEYARQAQTVSGADNASASDKKALNARSIDATRDGMQNHAPSSQYNGAKVMFGDACTEISTTLESVSTVNMQPSQSICFADSRLHDSGPIFKKQGSACSCIKSIPLILQIILGMLCAFKPAEPFVVPYLIENGITMDQINQKVFPVSGYSNFGFLLVLSLGSIGIPHQVLLYFGWVGYVLCYFLLVYSNTLLIAILVEVFYGLAVASETVYCAAFYFIKSDSVASETSNRRASTVSRTTLLIAHVISDLFGQLLISLVPGFPKRVLFVITACSVTLSILPLIVISFLTYSACCQNKLDSVSHGSSHMKFSAEEVRLTRKLYLRSLGYVWGGGIIRVFSLYVGIFALSTHTLYQNYITNLLYDVQIGTTDELYGVFVMAGRLSGVAGSLIALALKKVRKARLLLLILLIALTVSLIVPAFVLHLAWLFIANMAEFFIAELTITNMWTHLAQACQGSTYPAVFLCQALIVSALVLLFQGTVFNNVANEFAGFTTNQTHYFWCFILGCIGVIVSLIVAVATRNDQPDAGEARVVAATTTSTSSAVTDV